MHRLLLRSSASSSSAAARSLIASSSTLTRCSTAAALIQQRVHYSTITSKAHLPQSSCKTQLPLPHHPACAHHQQHHRSFSSVTFTPREKSIVKLLSSITHPSTNEDIVYSGHVRSVSERDGNVSIVLPLDDSYRELKKRITEQVTKERLPPGQGEWLNSVRVVMEAAQETRKPAPTSSSSSKPLNGLSHVRHIVAVSSCKGGVGKSTVAVNLAYALSRLPSSQQHRELRIGILDADVYGPSLPTMVSPRDTVLRINQAKRIIPLVYEGVKLMSYGFVNVSQKAPEKKNPNEQQLADAASSAASKDIPSGAFIRGPLASAAVRQMSVDTEWGELDYLIVDMPPGTGDIQLTLTQLLTFSGALIITTPQKLALIDVEKGLSLFQKTRVPLLGIIENMSYFLCTNCDTKHRLFGNDDADEMLNDMQKRYQVDYTCQLPISKELSIANDEGDPFILRNSSNNSNTTKIDANKKNDHQIRLLYDDIAKHVVDQVETLSQRTTPKLVYDANEGMVVLTEGIEPSSAATSSSSSIPSPSSSLRLPAYNLRLACRCAGCVDELTGVAKLNQRTVPKDVKPLGISPRGNYAVAVHWSDGHASSIYPFQQIRELISKQQA